MSSYVELHCHSAFSFLDGASLPDELVLRALEQGHTAMALTDHDTLSGSMEFAQAAGAYGLRAIHGAEVSVRASGRSPLEVPGHELRHLTLLVRDAAGWRSLCRLLTRAHAHTRETPTRRRDQLAPSVTLEDVAAHAEGLVALSGCARRGIHDEPSLRQLREAFGRERLRVELQRPFARDDRARNRRLEAFARGLELPCVATGNVHAHAPSRAQLQDAFVAVREHTTLDASEPLRRGNHTHVLAGPSAMAARFADHPDAVAETARLAATLTFDLGQDLGYRYPGSDDAEADKTLAATCQGLFDTRYPPGGRGPAGAAAQALRVRAAARLEQELGLIRQLGLSGFFILHHDLLELAREVAIEVRGPGTVRALLPPGRGRGSSVSSIVCYLTGLSHVDPVANELFLGRFLNAEITSLPDIDLDFPRDVRATLIPRIHERYGHDHSALVAAFPTYRSRGAVRELGKALGLPPGEIERVARASEGWGGQKVGEDVVAALGEGRLAAVQDAAEPAQAGRWDWLVRLAKEAQGLPRHLSQHSGGMIVATRPLVDCCPVVPAAMEGRQMVMWDKDSCADAGFLKIDLLGLGMLSAVERCVELIAVTSGERVDLSRIPYDDKPTYAAIQRAETTGVFQIESRAQMASLLRTLPESLDDLTIQVAIVRPGPIQGGAVNPYIDRRQRLRHDPSYRVPYEHPSLEPVLKDTLGTIIFQDQVIAVAMAFAGFSAGEAEGLRRAMSRKRSEAAMYAYRDRFIAGAVRTHGVATEVAERVYAMIVGFSGFGFPKAHGAAFGLLAYQSTWLRVHHGPELLCSLLDEQPMGFYPPDALVHEAQRRGITVHPPDVRHSAVECTLEPAPEGSAFASAVRLGLGYVIGVQGDEVAAIVAAREAGGPFTSVQDLVARAGSGRAALERLAWSGACDALVADEIPVPGHRRRAVLWRLGAAAPGVRLQARGPGGQRLEDHGTQLALPLAPPTAPGLPELGSWDAMIADYASSGVTTATHPVALLRGELERQRALGSLGLRQARHGRTVRVGGLVVARQRPGTAKGIVFMLLEDEGGTINLILPPEVYEHHRLLVRTEPLIVAEGRLERHPAAGGQVNVLTRRLWALEAPDRLLAEVKDFSPLDLRELERRTGESAAGDQAAAAADGQVAAAGGSGGDFRAVAPAVMSFGAGRRR
ncbi:DNA polymerase III subunit alpha [Paraconexibacter antarcticus]|uniref:DNA-directed DNA polymerase n=1 Tax=Paraconexibacter antarcticus TaxID=2949664 RepID=A0ABY5DZD9_9ACTN|nr:DNA polymerase III subunit alpha [Paraconexibacter antarcticus]UTI66919.1 DNA polymerase III subunit alpha [Paraconexibacter antarcticus]